MRRDRSPVAWAGVAVAGVVGHVLVDVLVLRNGVQTVGPTTFVSAPLVLTLAAGLRLMSMRRTHGVLAYSVAVVIAAVLVVAVVMTEVGTTGPERGVNIGGGALRLLGCVLVLSVLAAAVGRLRSRPVSASGRPDPSTDRSPG